MDIQSRTSHSKRRSGTSRDRRCLIQVRFRGWRPLPVPIVRCFGYRIGRDGLSMGAKNLQISRRDSFATGVSSLLKLWPPGTSS